MENMFNKRTLVLLAEMYYNMINQFAFESCENKAS